jgi:hypothetical protein
MRNVSMPQSMTVADASEGLVVAIGQGQGPASAPAINVQFDVCATWLELAVGHLSDAQVARGARIGNWDSANEHSKTGALKWEFEAAIQAITASGIALDAFCAVVQNTIHLPETLIAEWHQKSTPRHIQNSEVLRRAFSLAPKHVASLRQSLEEIFRFRDLAIDPSRKMDTIILHPELGVGVEWRFAYFRYQNAQLIVNATLRLIAELVVWCKPEDAALQKYLDALRSRLDPLRTANALRAPAPVTSPSVPDPESHSIPLPGG